ncbi:polysaccharide deacetylase family protein [Alicyclobacillus fodiniaquatilis]|uniref:Polysaccharide deacetylase family protein n=1 Tax=Alicyclobacillus fodiniaquatilis TaxID=1661150 RepID=A0ABW4JAV9_9BACL
MWWIIAGLIVLMLLCYCVAPVIWTRTFRKSCIYQTNQSGTVSLTFDDGPHPVYTPQLLDVLNALNVKATFFVLSHRAKQHPALIERMIYEGHDVEVHGHRHWFVPLLHPSATYRQCIGASRALISAFDIDSRVYRPTWGACNLATLLFIRVHRMRLCTWSVMVGDWRKTAPAELVDRIAKKLTDGAIIVLHDSDHTLGAEHGAPKEVIAAIPAIVQLVRAQGYQFVTISECV